MMLGRLTTTVALALGTVAIGVGPALATSPHFVSASATGPSSSGTLSVNFKEAGLGTNQNIDYTASADATATYACLNHGGNHPQASNKETVSSAVSTSGVFPSGKNGSVSGTLVISPPSAGSFSCPGGQTLVLAQVGYTDVVITDTTTPVSQSIPGTFSRTLFNV